MRKKIESILAISLSALMLTSSLSAMAVNIFASQTEFTKKSATKGSDIIDYEEIQSGMINTKEYNYLALNEMMEEENEYYEEYADIKTFYNSASEGEAISEDTTGQLPKSVDISTSEYFPEVGDQGSSGSCWHYGTSYACLTYANNKARGIKTTPENTINPMFCYNYAAGTKNSSLEGLLMQIGYPAVGVLPIDTKNTVSLYPIKEVWESAVRNRGGQYISYKCFGDEDEVVTSPDDSSIYVLKKKLSEGKPAALGSLAYNWNFSVVASGEHKGEIAIDRCDLNKTGGHIIAFVGYDDDIWVDINYDGKVQEAEMGAFKMVNSWGKDWGNDGYVWVAYDSLNKISQILTSEEVTRINKAIDAGTIKANKVNNSVRKSFFMFETYSNPVVRERITSECLVYMTVNTGSRREMTMSVTATSKKDGKSTVYEMPNYAGESGGKNRAWDGTDYSTDATMVFDLDNVISDITPETMEDYEWKVTFGDNTKDICSVTVKDVHFKVNGVKKYITSISKVPLNGSEKTYDMSLRKTDFKIDDAIVKENSTNVVIYYNNSKYTDGYIHYKVGSDSWTTAPGRQMCTTSEIDGYKWKYVINLGSATKLTACFNNGNGTWDNNNSSDYSIQGPGCYGIKDGKITKLTEPVEENDPMLEIDKSNITLKVSEEATITPTVIDGSKEDIVWSSSNEKVAIVTGGKVTAVSEGTALVTAKIGDVSVTCEVKVEKRNDPLTGTLTVAGSKENLTKVLGSKITIDAKGNAGSESYTYKFAVLNVDNGKWSILQDFNSNGSYTYELNYPGTKQFAVTVKDSIGATVATNRITVKVTNPVTPLAGTLKVNNSTATLTKVQGSKITLNALGTGGSGTYTYKFAVLNVDNGKWSILRDFNGNSSYTYSLDYTGTKQFAVTVKDSNGNTVATNRITVKVTAATVGLSAKLTANGAIGNVVAFVGDSVKLDVKATGGSGNYTYKYVVYNVNTNTWFTLKDFNSSATYTTKLSSVGIKQFVVSVKDSTGKTVATERVTINALS